MRRAFSASSSEKRALLCSFLAVRFAFCFLIWSYVRTPTPRRRDAIVCGGGFMGSCASLVEGIQQ